MLNYAWAADGHLANYSVYSDADRATTSYSAHWDGDTLLYVAFGGVMALYVEKLAFSENAGNGLWQTVVYDRDQTGTSVDTHFSTGASFYGFTALNLENVQPYQPPKACKGGRIGDIECSGQQTKAQPVSNGGPSYGLMEINEPQAPLDAKRGDGYFDGTIAIQGVRAYDPSMNQWTAPDAYSGGVQTRCHSTHICGTITIRFNTVIRLGMYLLRSPGLRGGEVACIIFEPCGAGKAAVVTVAGVTLMLGAPADVHLGTLLEERTRPQRWVGRMGVPSVWAPPLTYYDPKGNRTKSDGSARKISWWGSPAAHCRVWQAER